MKPPTIIIGFEKPESRFAGVFLRADKTATVPTTTGGRFS
jgi:hypothetical protein